MNFGRLSKMRQLGCAMAACCLGTTAAFSTSAFAQSAKPAMSLDSVMKTKIYDSGLIMLKEMDLAFAPEGPVDAKIVIRSSTGEATELGFFPDYRYTVAVFGKLQPQNHTRATLKPGQYDYEVHINNEVVTKVPFSVEAGSSNDDPFNPKTTYKFVGPWQKYGYFLYSDFKDIQSVRLYFFAGASDLPMGKKSAPVGVKVFRNGEMIGHSPETVGFLGNDWLGHYELLLMEPHTRDTQYKTPPLPKTELEKDGKYKLEIYLKETGEVIRQFAFESAGGKMIPLPQTVLGYEPHVDYIAPRVVKPGSSTYEFVEAFWVADPTK